MLYLYCYFEVTSDMYSIHHYFVITSVNFLSFCFLFYYIFAHSTVITDLAPQVAEANRGGPGKIKRNEIC